MVELKFGICCLIKKSVVVTMDVEMAWIDTHYKKKKCLLPAQSSVHKKVYINYVKAKVIDVKVV